MSAPVSAIRFSASRSLTPGIVPSRLRTCANGSIWVWISPGELLDGWRSAIRCAPTSSNTAAHGARRTARPGPVPGEATPDARWSGVRVGPQSGGFVCAASGFAGVVGCGLRQAGAASAWQRPTARDRAVMRLQNGYLLNWAPVSEPVPYGSSRSMASTGFCRPPERRSPSSAGWACCSSVCAVRRSAPVATRFVPHQWPRPYAGSSDVRAAHRLIDDARHTLGMNVITWPAAAAYPRGGSRVTTARCCASAGG